MIDLMHVWQEKYGFCFVKGVPPNPEDTQRLIERIAFIRVTHCQYMICFLRSSCLLVVLN